MRLSSSRLLRAFAVAILLLASTAANAVIMQSPPSVLAGAQIKLLSGATYTVDVSGFVSVTSQIDVIGLQNMGFTQVVGRSNFVATADPTVGNDNTQDYAPGSLWINTTASPPRAWVDVTNATGAAVWLQMTTGALIATANSPTFANATFTGLVTRSSNTAVTAFSGGGQGSATQLTTDFSNFTTAAASSSPYDSVKFNAACLPGQRRIIANSAANPVQLFGFNTDTVNGFASATGVTIPVGFVGDAECVSSGNIRIPALSSFSTTDVYNTNTATSGTTLTGANITGGTNEVTLNLTGTLGGAANAQLPTVANLVAAIPNAVAGMSYKLRIINSSSANFAWTLTNNSWTFNVATPSMAQNTWQDYYVTLNTTSAATIQSIGYGTYH